MFTLLNNEEKRSRKWARFVFGLCKWLFRTFWTNTLNVPDGGDTDAYDDNDNDEMRMIMTTTAMSMFNLIIHITMKMAGYT